MQRRTGFVRILATACAILLAACGKDVTQLVHQDQTVVVIVGTQPTQGGVFRLSKGVNCPNHTVGLTAQVLGISNSNAAGRWTSSNTAIATVDPSTGLVTAVSAGTATITFTLSDNGRQATATVVVDDDMCTSGNPGGVSAITLSPPGGSFPVGTTITVTASCSASGTQASCSGVSLSSSNPSVVQVNDASHIFCKAQGTAIVTVSGTVNGTAVSNQYTFTCTQGNTPTISLNQTGPITLRTGQNCLAAQYTSTVSTVGGVLANWSISNPSILIFQGPSSNVSTVTVAGVIGQSSNGQQITLTANGVNGGNASITFILDNTACSGGNQTLSVTPNPLNFTLCQAGFTGTTPPQRITLYVNNVAVAPTEVVYEQAGQLLSIDPVTGMATPANLGSSYVRISTKSNPTNYIQVPINVTNTGCTQTSLVVNPASINLSNCSGFLANYTPVVTISGTSTQVPVTWSGIGNLGTVNGGSFTLNGTVGTVTLTGTSQTGGTVQLPVTVTACQTSNGSITVTPNPLNIVLGNIGTVTAQLNQVSGTPTWTSTTGCTGVTNQGSLTTGVQGFRVCRDSLVVQVNGVKGYTIVNVTSPSTGCTISGPGSVGVNLTNVLNGNCGTTNPWWFSRDPLVVSILGAPFVCTYGGVGYPCGPTATIKGRSVGSTQVCVQPSPTDHSTEACQTETVTATSSGNLIPNDANGIELDLKTLGITWPTKAPAAGAKLESIMPMADYIAVKKAQMRKNKP